MTDRDREGGCVDENDDFADAKEYGCRLMLVTTTKTDAKQYGCRLMMVRTTKTMGVH